MEKNIKIIRPAGEDTYKVLCAFKNGENSYVILDSKLKDANGNTITFVCRENGNNLEFIDGDEWNQVKAGLINIVKGNTDIVYVDVKDSYQASDNIGHTIALKDAHISALTSNYKLPEVVAAEESMKNEISEELETPVEEIQEQNVASKQDNLTNAIDAANDPTIQIPVIDQNMNVEAQNGLESTVQPDVNNEQIDIVPQVEVQQENPSVVPVAPTIENSQEQTPLVEENNSLVQPAIEPNILAQPVVEVAPINDNMNVQTPEVSPIIENPVIENGPTVENQTPVNMEPQVNMTTSDLNQSDISVEEIRSKINALCDLLIEKEKQINEKEQMIDAKLQVANIAYNNAQNVNQMNNNETINIADYQSNDQARTLTA